MSTLVFAGTYTVPGFGEGEPGRGIYLFEFAEETGELRLRELIEGPQNPSFLRLSPDGRTIYCVSETEEFQGLPSGAVTVFKTGGEGRFMLVDTKPTYGGSPCHIIPDFGNRLLYVSNYSGGSVCVYALAGEGIHEDTILGDYALSHHSGKGIRADRQESPHPHSVTLTADGGYAIAADLGTDTLVIYSVKNTGDGPVMTRREETSLPPGSGPRISLFHPRLPLMYVVNELNSTVSMFSCTGEGIPERLIDTIPALPAEVSPEGNYPADIRFSADGRYLYVSNRGHDSLSVFSVDPGNGKPELIQNIPSGGRFPRSFTISPGNGWLLAANQNSGNIAVFRIAPETGLLEYHSSVGTPAPVCLQSIPL
jgi:6-phosphogluconolactonase